MSGFWRSTARIASRPSAAWPTTRMSSWWRSRSGQALAQHRVIVDDQHADDALHRGGLGVARAEPRPGDPHRMSAEMQPDLGPRSGGSLSTASSAPIDAARSRMIFSPKLRDPSAAGSGIVKPTPVVADDQGQLPVASQLHGDPGRVGVAPRV